MSQEGVGRTAGVMLVRVAYCTESFSKINFDVNGTFK